MNNGKLTVKHEKEQEFCWLQLDSAKLGTLSFWSNVNLYMQNYNRNSPYLTRLQLLTPESACYMTINLSTSEIRAFKCFIIRLQVFRATMWHKLYHITINISALSKLKPAFTYYSKLAILRLHIYSYRLPRLPLYQLLHNC